MNVIVLAPLLLAGCIGPTMGLEFPGPAPGPAKAKVNQSSLVLENNVLVCTWSIQQGQLKPDCVTDNLLGASLPLQQAECFQIVLSNGNIIKASDMKIYDGPVLKKLRPKYNLPRVAEQFAGNQITIKLVSADGNLEAQWRAVLRDGSNYIRQQVTLRAKNEPISMKEIVLLELSAPQVRVMGIVDGSPVVSGNMFFAYEHPMSKSQILYSNLKADLTYKKPIAVDEKLQCFRCSLPRSTTLAPGEPLMQSSVIGVVPQGQLRRGFLHYVERERARPYRQFLHYNSWYDIAWVDRKMHEQECLDVIEQFGKELIKRRKVAMDSFIFDDGWDDNTSLWQFHKDFPNGFTPLRRVAEKYDSALGVWLSPWGGYGQAKSERLKYGRQQGFEINKRGLSLEGPNYYKRFRDVCVNMVRQYNVNYFKFDGIGAGNGAAGAGTEFVGDIEAMLRLVGELRGVRPDVFVNMTTGTWPSPYWLWDVDSVWRAGSDWGTCGWGSKRQQQMTYRDNETYRWVVSRAPLYPLNSLMTQGIMFANHGLPNEVNDLVDDIRTFFASGTNCQELYITASLMRSEDWDALAEAAKWSGDNADVLVDTHWIGGEPAVGKVYGWACWSERKGILALRNPKNAPGKISVDIGKAFELPKDAAQKYTLKSPWKKDADKPPIMLSVGKNHTFELKPFELLVFDAMPLN